MGKDEKIKAARAIGSGLSISAQWPFVAYIDQEFLDKKHNEAIKEIIKEAITPPNGRKKTTLTTDVQTWYVQNIRAKRKKRKRPNELMEFSRYMGEDDKEKVKSKLKRLDEMFNAASDILKTNSRASLSELNQMLSKKRLPHIDQESFKLFKEI